MMAKQSPPAVKFAISEDESLLVREIVLNSPQNTTIDQATNVTTFSPVMTPRDDRSGSIVLLSPSRTIAESLTVLATQTGNQLEEVWDEVGYSPEDRASQLSDLLVKIQQLCQQKIAEETGVAETFRQTIKESKEEIKRTALALRTTVDPYMPKEEAQPSLSDELAALESTLESLRASAKEARDELTQSRDYLIEAHEVLGLSLSTKWLDIESDLTATRRQDFLRKRDECKEEISSRMSAVIQLVRDCQHLMADLQLNVGEEGSDLDRRIAGSLVRSKDGSFILSSKMKSTTCVGMHSSAVDELTKRVAELHREKQNRKAKLQDMGGEIALLWEKLHVAEEEQIAFTESVQGLGMDTIHKGEIELNRLLRLKSQMLGKLVCEARDTIKDLWDQVNATSEERVSFVDFQVSLEERFDDELLDRHESYIGQLQNRLEQMRPILRMIERREIIVEERFTYEELQKDPDRLQRRGADMTRQLMKEEKMARRIKRDLPRLTDHLHEKLKEWKTKNGNEFLFQGEAYLQTMCRQEEEWNRYKEDEIKRKLKKKQEENGYLDNRFKSGPSRHPSRKKGRGPLGNAQGLANRQQGKQSQEKTTSRVRNDEGRSEAVRL